MSCEQCKETGLCQKKSGLPIFLVRYGIAPELGPEGKHYPETGAPHLPYNIRNKRADLPKGGFNIAESRAPKISGKFKVEPGIDLGKCTFYTLRTLRGGCFVYVYDEAREEWHAYYMTYAGFLEPRPGVFYDPSKKKAPLSPGKTPCQAWNRAQASFITIRDPEGATNVWIALSDVEWTKDVFERYDGKSAKAKKYRQDHMRKFDVKKWVGSKNPEHDHAARIGELEKHVADFAKQANESAFFFSPSSVQNWQEGHSTRGSYDRAFSLLARSYTVFYKTSDPDHPIMSKEELEALPEKDRPKEVVWNANEEGVVTEDGSFQIISACKRIRPDGKGVILSLDDPMGITQELGGLMANRLEAFARQPKHHKKVLAGSNIVAARQIISDQSITELHTMLNKLRIWRKGRDEVGARMNEWIKNGRQGLQPANTRLPTRFPPCEEFPRGFNLRPEDAATIVSTLQKEGVFVGSEGWTEEPSEERLKLAIQKREDEAWRKYLYKDYNKKNPERSTLRYKEDERVAFMLEYGEKVIEYLKEIILPISEAHAKWLDSTKLANYFEGNYSTENAEHGAEFVHHFSLCVADTLRGDGTQEPCKQVLLKWMADKNKFTDKRNLLLRALALNHDKLAERFDAHIQDLEKIMGQTATEFVGLLTPSATEEELRKDQAPVEPGLFSKAGAHLKKFADIWNTSSASIALSELTSNPNAIPALEQLVVQVSAAFNEKLLTPELRKSISSFLGGVAIYTRLIVVDLGITGTGHQHREVMKFSILNAPESQTGQKGGSGGWLSSAKKTQDWRGYIPARAQTPAGQMTLLSLSTVSVDAIIGLSDSFSSLAEKGSLRRGDLKMLMQTLSNRLNISPEALNDLFELKQVQTGADLSKFFQRAQAAQAVQAKIAEAERRLGEFSAATERANNADAALNEARTRAANAQIEYNRTLAAVRSAAGTKGAAARKNDPGAVAEADRGLQGAQGAHADSRAENTAANRELADRQRALDAARADATERQIARDNAQSAARQAETDYMARNEDIRNERTARGLDKKRRNARIGSTTFGLFNYLMAGISLKSTWEQLKVAPLWSNQWQTRARFGSLVLSTVGMMFMNVASVFNFGYNMLANVRKFATSGPWRPVTWLRTFGKWLGYIGGFLSGAADILDGVREIKKGNFGFFAAFLASGVLAIVGTVLIIKSVLAIGLVLLGISFVVSTILGFLVDDKIQEYLHNCIFGANSAKWKGWAAWKEQQAFADAIRD